MENSKQANTYKGNVTLNDGSQGNTNNDEDFSQNNDRQDNGVANGGTKDNESNAKNTNQLPNTGNSDETTNGTLIGSILAALGALFLGIRKKSE
ncbi:LPXTG cell wall anchor domain-containing protein [Staphylococcus epidermidis]|uniref:LPXTG cell wall anchor domain-containing protein n=1 Tax=Staphylococcus epidermidis TaxID=1282 RepID=UPI00338FBEAC